MKIINKVISNEVSEKIEFKHHVSEFEIIEAFSNQKYLKKTGGNQYKLIGRTISGRCLAIFFKYFKGTAEITSARNVDKYERKRC